LQLAGRPLAATVADSLPARLHAAGYRMAYFSSNPWAGARRQGFGADFDHEESDLEWETAPCFDVLSQWLPYLCAASSNPMVILPFKLAVRAANAVGLLDMTQFADPSRLTAAATEWAALPHASPVFLWIHYLPPHDPYAPPPPWVGRFDPSPLARTEATSHPQYLFEAAKEPATRVQILETRYDESVSYVDHFVGEFIRKIDDSLGPNTLILLTADHGESFSHGYGGHGGIELYEDLLHIPLMIRLPGAQLSPVNRHDLSEQADLAPTIAAIAGIEPSPRWEGVSLLGSPEDSERSIFAMSFEQNRSRDALVQGSIAALRGPWKLVRFMGSPHYPEMPLLETQLFDLAHDPDERQNVARDHADVVAMLSKQIDGEMQRHGAPIAR
jgi:arylsulfatase A-like enzyme